MGIYQINGNLPAKIETYWHTEIPVNIISRPPPPLTMLLIVNK